MGIKIDRLPNTDKILKAIKDNDGYCVCQIKKTNDSKCMCKKFRETKGDCVCDCGLYQKKITKD